MEVAHIGKYDKKNIKYFKENLNNNISIDFIEKDDIKNKIFKKDYRVVIGNRVDYDILNNISNLKYYIIPFAGIPEKDKKNIKKLKEVTLLNLHFNARFVAEHAVALLLTLSKKIIPAHNMMKNNDWSFRYENNYSYSFYKKTVGLIGYGEIGKYLKQFCEGFGMNVLAVKKTKSTKNFIYNNSELKYVLNKSDFIIISLPKTKETINYISFDEFNMMKKNTLIVNVGRGDVINQDALYTSLKKKNIAGAAIDTWWYYPEGKNKIDKTKPSKYDFSIFDNFIFSPHRASHIKNREYYRIQDLINLLNNLARDSIKNKVNKNIGY